MIHTVMGAVTRIVRSQYGVQEIGVMVAGTERLAFNQTSITGEVGPGDRVVLNATATHLELGSGGYDFVMYNASAHAVNPTLDGHIMRLRYTPAQHSVLAVEEPASPHHAVMADSTTLSGTPVVCCGLHSQIAAVAAAVAASQPSLNVVYVMDDAACLSLGVSKLVGKLTEAGLIRSVITCGQAFGGDLEAVNVFSGLLAARHVLGADVIITSQGVGNTGTATPFGFSGAAQAISLNAAGALGGAPVACLRVSYGDARTRHWGVSHHSLTVLSTLALTPCHVPAPVLQSSRLWEMMTILDSHGITAKHRVSLEDGAAGVDELLRRNITVTTMGRSIKEDPDYFLAAAAAGAGACRILGAHGK